MILGRMWITRGRIEWVIKISLPMMDGRTIRKQKPDRQVVEKTERDSYSWRAQNLFHATSKRYGEEIKSIEIYRSVLSRIVLLIYLLPSRQLSKERPEVYSKCREDRQNNTAEGISINLGRLPWLGKQARSLNLLREKPLKWFDYRLSLPE